MLNQRMVTQNRLYYFSSLRVAAPSPRQKKNEEGDKLFSDLALIAPLLTSFELFHNTHVPASANNFTHLAVSLFTTYQDLARAYINVKFDFSFCGLSFEETKFPQSQAK